MNNLGTILAWFLFFAVVQLIWDPAWYGEVAREIKDGYHQEDRP